MTLITRNADGRIVVRNGAIGTEQSCCCEQEDPGRIVKCCYGGVCADVTAAECQFLGGFEVGDCSECPQPPGLPVANCSQCCTQNEINAVVTGYINDPYCRSVQGSGQAQAWWDGRLGRALECRANITLQKATFSQCDYVFSACGSLTDFGGITALSVRVGYNVVGGKCEFVLRAATMAVASCYGFDNPNPDSCTQPTTGGSCRQFFGVPSSRPAPAHCSGASFLQQTETYTYVFNSRFTVVTGGLVTGSPKVRDVGFQSCSSLGMVPTGEATHTVFSRLSVRIV